MVLQSKKIYDNIILSTRETEKQQKLNYISSKQSKN